MPTTRRGIVGLTSVIAASALCCVLAGCHGGSDRIANAPRTEKPSATAGWKDITTSGVALRLPNDWKVVDFAKDKFEEAQSKVFGDDPKFASMKSQVSALAKQGLIKLFAYDAESAKTGFPITCNIVSQNIGGDLVLEQVADASVQQMKSVVASGTEPKLEYRNVPAGKMAVIRAEIKTPNPSVPQLVSFAHVMTKGPVVFNVTFGGPVTSEEKIKQVGDQAMEAFHYTQ